MKKSKKSGFTLVELAIVLVIIGLIIGGVLVGQDLIKAAEIRATATQIEKYNTAATAFRTKYDGYPGDLIQSRAATFGLTNFAAGLGADGLEDGDGVLENGGTAANKQGVGGEATLFWRHLTEAQFISDAFTAAMGDVAVVAASDAAVGTFLPTLKIRDSADVHVTGIGGRNYFYISAITAITAVTGAVPGEGPALTPTEAESVDQKVDDGVYSTGIFRAFASLGDATLDTQDPGGVAAAGVCVDQGAGAPIAGDEEYSVANANFSSSVGCRVRWRASF